MWKVNDGRRTTHDHNSALRCTKKLSNKEQFTVVGNSVYEIKNASIHLRNSDVRVPIKCDYRTDRHTNRLTDAGQSDPYE